MVAFLDKYRSNHLLGPDCDEVDYNFGTVFHRLGVFRLLLPFRSQPADCCVPSRPLSSRQGALHQDPRPGREGRSNRLRGQDPHLSPSHSRILS
jgi:hypothetical protein